MEFRRTGARTSEKHIVLPLLSWLGVRGVRVPDMGSARRRDGDFAYLPGGHITEANASTATSRVAWESAVGTVLLLFLLNRILTRLFVRDALGPFRAHDDNMQMREATEDLATLASGPGGPSGSGLATWVWIFTVDLVSTPPRDGFRTKMRESIKPR